MHAHVVGHEIEDEPDVGLRQRLAQSQERFFAAEFRIERVVVDDVVAMRAAGAGLEKGRSIEMADAECLEVRHDARGVVEAEVWA